MTEEPQYEIQLIKGVNIGANIDGQKVAQTLGNFPNMNSAMAWKIVREVERVNSAGCFVGTMEECKKWQSLLNKNSIASRIRSICSDYKIILIDTLAIDDFYVGMVLNEVLDIGLDEAFALTDKVNKSETNSVSCYEGYKEDCERLAKMLQDKEVPCEVRKND